MKAERDVLLGAELKEAIEAIVLSEWRADEVVWRRFGLRLEDVRDQLFDSPSALPGPPAQD